MKFQKTLNLWEVGVQEKIQRGEIELQRGQWLICGSTNGKRCRYVSHTERTIDVVHWQGSAKETTELFNRKLENLKKA